MSGPLVVVGDALLDVDVTGVVRRMCPDAPAPVLDVQQERARPGGAALAASLAASDGVPVVLATVLADDEPAQWLRRMLTGQVELVHGTTDASTPVKTRLRCEGHSLARFDRGGGRGVLRVGEDVLDAVAGAAAVLVSDYGRGLSSDQRLRKVLRDVARHVPVVWDPHPLGAPSVPDVHLVTPNQAEVAAIIGCDASTFRGAEHAVHALRERWHVRGVAITMGRHGALLGYGAAAPVAVPAAEVSVADPCGAATGSRRRPLSSCGRAPHSMRRSPPR
jgi:bifunctional ADP-heptose synthase (sugar kinase/adenylyltransferase)